MHSSVRWLMAGLLVSLSLACSARGGGGFTDPDAATGSDADPSPMDSAGPSPDVAKGPDDVGVVNDLTQPPSDNGFPPVDLGAPARCGDGLCTSGETCTSCSADCGACAPRCGDGACQSGESCTSCSADCGACAPRCGDGSCNGTDTCANCPGDCGSCAAPCSTITNCAACAADTRCGWCTFPGACEAGNSSGPSGDSFCPTVGTWVRSASSCSGSDAGVRDAGTTDAGAVNITRSCTSSSTTNDGLESDCGWVLGQTYTCTAGSLITVGCTGPVAGCPANVGTCAGDPMMRVCAGSGQCTATGRMTVVTTTGYSEDDACGTCPLARYTCPSAGRITVYQRGFYVSRDAGATFCTIGRQ